MPDIAFKRRHTFLGKLAIAACPGLARADLSDLLVNGDAETHDLTGWTRGGTSNPGIDTGTFDPGFNPYQGSADFYGGSGASGTLTQTVNLLGFAPTFEEIDSTIPFNDNPLATALFQEQSLDQGTSDAAGVRLNFLSASNAVLDFADSNEITDLNHWAPQQVGWQLPSGTRKVQYQMYFVRHSGTDIDAFVDANQLFVSHPGTAWIGGAGSSWSNASLWDFGAPQFAQRALAHLLRRWRLRHLRWQFFRRRSHRVLCRCRHLHHDLHPQRQHL